jgi:hypothetical protein
LSLEELQIFDPVLKVVSTSEGQNNFVVIRIDTNVAEGVKGVVGA